MANNYCCTFQLLIIILNALKEIIKWSKLLVLSAGGSVICASNRFCNRLGKLKGYEYVFTSTKIQQYQKHMHYFLHLILRIL